MNLPLVSVLMTSHNRAKYLGEAIESVLASTYTNFELIIVDDLSKENNVAIAKSYAERDPRVKVYVNERNLGDYPNRNKAASYASGDYLKYVDSDDYIYPWGLDLLVRMMEAFPECGWGLCSLRQDFAKPFPLELSPKQSYEYNYLGPGLFHKAPLSSIIRKKVFDEVGGFALVRLVGDFEMWHKLAQKYKVLLMPDGIVWYREHELQEKNSMIKGLAEYEKIIIRYLKSKECPLDPETVSKILKKRLEHSRWDLIKSSFKFNPEILKLQWKRWRSYHEK
jgi:glycosyltransferase involved in cell wall biosynthesis